MRPRRALKPGARYSVTARINRDEQIIADPAFKTLFLEILERAQKRYSFSINNLCILDSIVKMIIHPKNGANLSRIMQWLLSVFAINYNKIMQIHGHVWYDRFKSSIIDDIRTFIECFRNICTSFSSMIKNGTEDFHGIQMLARKDFSIVEKPPDEMKESIREIIRSFIPEYDPG